MLVRRSACLAAGLCGALCSASGLALADGAPPPLSSPPVFTWTGFYIGAHMGGGANLSDVSDPLGPSLFGNPNLAPGPFAGGQIGYNYQSGVFVYGVEADVSFAEMMGTSTCSALSGDFINSNCRIGIDAFGTLAGRLGVAVGSDGRSLIYGKAGAAWSSGAIDIATNDSTVGAAGNPFTRRSTNLNRWGWMLGAGAERALSGNWSIKAEYDYANFGKQSASLLPSAVLASTGAVVDFVPARQGHVSDEMHIFKLGLNYRLGEHVPPADENALGSLKDVPATAVGPYGFEIGGRYWYSWGRHKYDLGLGKGDPVPGFSLISRLTYDDLEANTGEVTGRFTAPWNLFAKGFLGGGSIAGGRMNDEDFNIAGDTVARIPYTNTLSPKVEGDIPAYGTIDVGYDWWRTQSARVGAYLGYNYYSESYGALGVFQTANPLGPFGPGVGGPLAPVGHPIITQDATWQSLRVGAATEFYLAPRLKFSGDAAYLPYVSVDAVDTHFFGGSARVASVNPLTGYGVGTQLEAMLSYDVTERLSVGVGARYWAMWTRDGSFRRTYDADDPVTYPLPHQHLRIETERAGILGQVQYRLDAP